MMLRDFVQRTCSLPLLGGITQAVGATLLPQQNTSQILFWDDYMVGNVGGLLIAGTTTLAYALPKPATWSEHWQQRQTYLKCMDLAFPCAGPVGMLLLRAMGQPTRSFLDVGIAALLGSFIVTVSVMGNASYVRLLAHFANTSETAPPPAQPYELLADAAVLTV